MRDFSEEMNQLTERVIGAAVEVHRELGKGFLEKSYANALAIEFELRNISFEREVPCELMYKQWSIGDGRIDFLVEGRLVVELKACDDKAEEFRRQVSAYLKATELTLGLVINFHQSRLVDGVIRVANSNPSALSSSASPRLRDLRD